MREPARSSRGARRRTVWRDCSAGLRLVRTGTLLVAVALAVLVAVEPAVLPLAVVALAVDGVLLLSVRRCARRQAGREAALRAEVARGVAEMEHWLSSRRWA